MVSDLPHASEFFEPCFPSITTYSFSNMFLEAFCPPSLTTHLLVACALLFAAHAGSAQNSPPNPAAREDILSANQDRTVDPAKDFFSYANGGWLLRHPIPASEAGWGMGDLVREEHYDQLRKVSEEAAKWRVNVPLSNLPEFHEAFAIKPGAPMGRPPESHVKV